MSNIMKAVRLHAFGGPEVLVAREIPVPEVRPHDLLVRVAAVSVSAASISASMVSACSRSRGPRWKYRLSRRYFRASSAVRSYVL